MEACVRLADAMALGFTLVEFDPNCWLLMDGKCGCAFGGAILAVGRQQDFWKQIGYLVDGEWVAEMAVVKELWPWITAEHINRISDLAREIDMEQATKEDILTYVRSIEPAEEPSIFELPDISLEEQHRLEEIEAESESANLGGYQDPAYERNGR